MSKYLPIYIAGILLSIGVLGWYLVSNFAITDQAAQLFATQSSGYGAATYGGGVFSPAAAVQEGSSSGGGSGSGGGSRSNRSNNDDTDNIDNIEEVDGINSVESAIPETPSPIVETVLPANASSEDYVPAGNISLMQPQFNEASDVLKLQRFLNTFEGEALSLDGIYNEDDNAAVQRFQQKYKREILEVWNLSEPTGFVGMTTRLKIQFLVNGQTAQCPAFTEYNGGLDGVFVSDEIARTKQIFADLGMYSGPIDRLWTPETHEAMVVFQETFREVMLDPWNIDEGTGFKYKTTNKFLNYLAGCETDPVYLEGVGEFQGI